MLFFCLLIFFKIIFLKEFFQEYHQNVKQFWTLIRPDEIVGLDLGQNCLPRLSADDIGRQLKGVSNQRSLSQNAYLNKYTAMAELVGGEDISYYMSKMY